LVASTSEAKMDASSCELFTKVVVRFAPFHVAAAPLTKLDPFTVRVNAGLPAEVVGGVRLIKIGGGFGLEFSEVIVNEAGFDDCLSGLITMTLATVFALVASMSDNGMAPWSWKLLTNVVVLFAPFQVTAAPEIKLAPFTINRNAGLPAEVVFGRRILIIGAGFPTVPVTVNGSEFDVPPPGAGLKTVT